MRVNVIEFILAMIFVSVAITLIGSLLIDVLGAVF
jgi:hypothetical protein